MQDLNFCFFWETTRLDCYWIRSLRGNLSSLRVPKMLPIKKILFIPAHVSSQIQAWNIPPEVAIENSLLLEQYWVKTLSILILHWNRGTKIARSYPNLKIWTHFDFQTRFSPKKLTRVLSSKFQSLFFCLCCICPINNVTFHPINGIFSKQKLQKLLLVLTRLDNQSHISLALPPSFSLQRVNR